MRAQIREQLKNNQGAALSMVMVLLVVMSILGTAMYVYTMQSLKVLEFGTARQKAEYLARSGIEASVFMYQDAMLQYNSEEALRDFIDQATDDGNPDTDETITTNWVYLLQDGQTYVDGGNGEEPAPISDEYVGYYRVTITNDQKSYEMPDGQGGTQTKIEYIKRFTSVGYSGTMAATKKAYIVPLVDITGKGWVKPDGEISLNTAQSDDTSIIVQTTVSVDCGLIDTLINRFPGIFGSYSAGRVKNQPLYLGCTSGNMVITKPEESEDIHFTSEAADHMGGFVSLGNLFVESDINVEPMSKQFNMLYLRGNQIVVDGDINMYVYDPGTNNANGFTSWITGLAAKIARNYRLGTVVIGSPSSVASTVTDPMPTDHDDPGGLGECGQIFFGGDVYVNFISRNSTRKYKVFSAGDICYFDGDFEINGQPYGVDLVKYFLDTALEEGNYSSTVLTQFERTREFYYSETDEVYSNYRNGYQTPSMRLISIDDNRYDTVADTVLPSAGDAAYIIWE